MNSGVTSSEGSQDIALPVFEVMDVLGLTRLVKRSGDLGGSVPLRVAQGCTPLFEGNAFGFQVTLTQPITLRRTSGGFVADIASPYREALIAGHRAIQPRLLAQGFVEPEAALSNEFADHFVAVEACSTGGWRVRLWTGLLVRTDPGVWLRVSATANRRNRLVGVAEQFIRDDGRFVPLILDMSLPADAPARVSLVGEVGTVAPMDPTGCIEDVPLVRAPEVGLAHAAFYDDAYFEAKAERPTRKYRRMKLPVEPPTSNAPVCCRVVTAGPAAHTIAGGIPHVVFSNLVPFEVSFDGYSVAVDLEQEALRAGARAVERTFAEALGPTFLGQNRHAMWYFTKYVTPHPPGEPHFFVKPWAFMQTPPGWSCLLEGIHGDGFDVLRGVVATDVFHATPAVFHLFEVGRSLRVGYGEPLLKVIPIPRRLLRAGFRHATFRHATFRHAALRG